MFEYTVDYPTADAMNFLYYINCRVHRSHRSGRDFYDRAAWYLFEQGRGVPYTEFDQAGGHLNVITTGRSDDHEAPAELTRNRNRIGLGCVLGDGLGRSHVVLPGP